MGMFDRINFSCPHCGFVPVQAQSKGGPCELKDYDGDNEIPLGVAAGCIGDTLACDGCARVFEVTGPSGVHVWLTSVYDNKETAEDRLEKLAVTYDNIGAHNVASEIRKALRGDA